MNEEMIKIEKMENRIQSEKIEEEEEMGWRREKLELEDEGRERADEWWGRRPFLVQL